MGVAPLMGAKAFIVVLAYLWRGNKIALLAKIIGATHTDKPRLLKVVFLFGSQRNRIDERGQVVGVAAHDLDKSIPLPVKSRVVNALGIHFTETELASLSNEATSAVREAIIILLFVLISDWGTVDDDVGPVNRLLCFAVWVHTQLLEVLPPFLVHAKFGARSRKYRNFRLIRQ